jgi:endonuclease III
MSKSIPFAEIMEQLRKYYNDEVPALTRIAAERNSPFLVLIGCLLSLRTKDETTDVAMEKLMRKVKTPEDLIEIPTPELETIIYPVGFYRNKARLIKEVAQTIIQKYHDQVPDTIEELVTIRGIGRKTANIVVTEGFGKAGIAVDTHVHRISNRMGIVRTKNPNDTEQALRQILPQEYWRAYNPLLVTHGQRTCTPFSPFCSRCPINGLCEKVGVTRSR